MSELATAFRPLSRMGWGGKAASHWRGLVQTDDRDLAGRTAINRGQIGTVVYRSTGVRVNFAISGVTRDSGGVALGGCRVELYVTGSDQPLLLATSDASGNFNFGNPGTGPFYIVAYKAGSPDVSGTSVNSLLPA